MAASCLLSSRNRSLEAEVVFCILVYTTQLECAKHAMLLILLLIVLLIVLLMLLIVLLIVVLLVLVNKVPPLIGQLPFGGGTGGGIASAGAGDWAKDCVMQRLDNIPLRIVNPIRSRSVKGL